MSLSQIALEAGVARRFRAVTLRLQGRVALSKQVSYDQGREVSTYVPSGRPGRR